MPPTERLILGIIAADEAAIDEAFGSLPAQLKMTDKTPVSLTPAVVSFWSFFQTSKQSIGTSSPGDVLLRSSQPIAIGGPAGDAA